MRSKRKFRVGLFNLMPNKEETEQHWKALCGPALTNIALEFITTQSYQSKRTPKAYLNAYYHLGVPSGLDALIITGAPFGQKPYESILYWQELAKVIEQAHLSGLPMFLSCWAANAALYSHYKIQPHLYPQKISGVFPHKVTQHPLTEGIPEQVVFPHSRYAESHLTTVKKHPQLQVLLESEEAGIAFLVDQGRNAYLFAHPEYEIDTLYREYTRDLSRGLNPELPTHCQFSVHPTQEKIKPHWQAYGSLLLNNWFKYIGLTR